MGLTVNSRPPPSASTWTFVGLQSVIALSLKRFIDVFLLTTIFSVIQHHLIHHRYIENPVWYIMQYHHWVILETYVSAC